MQRLSLSIVVATFVYNVNESLVLANLCSRLVPSIAHISRTEWPRAVPAIQAIINKSPSRRLGGRAPITVHSGMQPGNPLTVALTTSKVTDVESLDHATTLQKLKIDDMLAF